MVCPAVVRSLDCAEGVDAEPGVADVDAWLVV